MESVVEQELIFRKRQGEPEAFSELLKQHQHSVYSLILQIVSSQQDAEELTQDVFMKAYHKISSFRGESSISTWLYRIAYNTAISAVRKKKPVIFSLDENMINGVPDQVVDEMLNQEDDDGLLASIKQAVQKLHPEEKALVSLYYNREKPVKEVAAIMNLSDANVK